MFYGLGSKFNNSVFFIPTTASPNPVKQDSMMKHQAHLLHQKHKEYGELTHLTFTGAVWDDELKKMASYKELDNHCNNIICNQ